MTAIRDHRGRFQPGTAPGPGRPKRETELAYLKATQEGCPPDTWLEIVKRATADAMNGDSSARSFLAKYLLPVPTAEKPARPETRAGQWEPVPRDELNDILDALNRELDKEMTARGLTG